MNSEYNKFQCECDQEIAAQAENTDLVSKSREWLRLANEAKYSYHFQWMGRPIIQYPQDIVALQEIIWNVRPDVIVETGIAHGGSLVLSASLLALLDLCDATGSGEMLDPNVPRRHVVGVDVDIRSHNRRAIEGHPLANRITMIEGSSVDEHVIKQVSDLVGSARRVLVCLDSNHIHDHVLSELQAYAPLVTPNSYCIVFDTVIEHFEKEMFPDRPWGPGNNPKSAVHEWLKGRKDFVVDEAIDNKLLISVAPGGFLRRVE